MSEVKTNKLDERDKKLKEKYSSKHVIKRLLKDVKPIAWSLIVAGLLCLVSVAVWLASPYLLGESIDILNAYYIGEVTDRNTVLEQITGLATILLICYLAKTFSDTVKMILLNNTVSRFFTAGMRVRMSNKIKFLPVSYIDYTPFGELISRMMHDVSRMGNTVHTFIGMLIMGIFQLVAIIVIVYFINPIVATVVLASVPISIVVSSLIASHSEKFHSKLHRSYGDLYAGVEEHYGGFSTVKAYNLERRQEKKIGATIDNIVEASNKVYIYSDIMQPIIAFTFNITFVVVCIIGGMMAISGKLSVGEIVQVVLYAKLLANPLESIAYSYGQFQRVLASSRRVYDVIDTEEMSKNKDEHFGDVQGNVEFKNVEFSYTEKPLIKNLNFEVAPGQKVAIVGPTGAGKTTIVNLLMRFYDIKSGDILIDGKSIYSVPREELRSLFGMVLQDTWLFGGTVKENIAFGKDGVTDEEVQKACDTAYCDYFIKTLPEGYDTIITSDMTSISAGQKQLLTIARAFIADRKILILDEATSNIDTRTEIYIQKAMDKLMKDRTSFVIAHRLSTIVNADLILVIRDGDIVESGTHKALLEKHGFYYELYNAQYSLNANN